MAEKRRTVPAAVRELCLAFPETEEFESHGSPNFRARTGRVFAVFALNHHGDGHVALWLNTPAMEQARLLASAPRHIFKPPYVGPAGWIGVELNRGFPWRRVAELAHMAYVHSSPAKLVARVNEAPRVAAPNVKMKPAEIDRLKTPKALKMLAVMRRLCLALPQVEESLQFGTPVWRVGKRGFAMLYDHGKGLIASFWVGIERQGPLEMDPRFRIPAYMGHNGWIALDSSDGAPMRELREFIIESYRHFAPRKAVAVLDAQQGVA
jgi:predicted DNA-binding protein (MmcQ/YjbR family)